MRKITDQKRAYYYPLLVKTASGEPPIPVAEMLTTDHSTANIISFLMKFLRDVGRVCTSVKTPSQIEIDMSWAMIHATCKAFNSISIDHYLVEAWKFAMGDTISWELCTVHLCAAHVIHLLSTKLRNVKEKPIRQYTLYIFGAIQNTTTLKEADQLYKQLCTVLQIKTATRDVEEARSALSKQLSGPTGYVDQGEKGIVTIDDVNLDVSMKQKTIKERSPFYLHFEEIRNKISPQKDGDDAVIENLYFCPEALQHVASLMHLYPMWSGMLLQNKTRDTNSQAELWMRITKREILKGKKKVTPATFVRRMHVSLRGRLRRKSLPKKSKCFSISKAKQQEETFANEKWERKKPTPKKSKYYSKPSELPMPKRRTKGSKRESTEIKTEKSQVTDQASSRTKALTPKLKRKKGKPNTDQYKDQNKESLQIPNVPQSFTTALAPSKTEPTSSQLHRAANKNRSTPGKKTPTTYQTSQAGIKTIHE